ncbi:MAG: HEAT repeat-containing PBS lyase [Methanoculleus marisnigri]|jgi:hypothetical protein|uniref:HEAT repeat-containing PBS lyase n=1 Tax=Methanoculleus marisnigri TaxID=2198 RepID=A0A117MDW6_9EURY|nr:MAG: HEAT repeat-containing PBS lyase [Methanoculleus marisnigri]
MQEMIERGMVKVEDSARVRELMHTMLNGDVYTSMQAVGNLGAIGAPAVGPLMQALLAADSNARWTVAMALAEIERVFEQSGEAFTGLAMEAYEGT